jgi:RNAse (barnase) inhibitor barstar
MSEELPTVEIDGAEFATLEEFFAHFSDRALDGSYWVKNLDAFNDVLRGGFGTPKGGFRLVWRNHATSRERLGYPETVLQLEKRLARCHPTNRVNVQAELEQARSARGSTVFDWLVEILLVHCAGGAEEEDGVELVLA